ncbi:MAG: TonB-dependent receptor [Myxococcales bacterium]|nr:TonB-dependent receptor [Myxococcales bacterium]
MKLVVAVSLGLFAAGAPLARAEEPPAAVDVADLPPLPATSEETTTTATVLAASSAEEDVVVGAAKREQSLGNVASAVTVVSSDRIKRFGYRTVGEAVSAVAGTYLEDDRIVPSLGIRGMNVLGDFNTRILVLVDGATVNEAWGSFAGVGFDTFVSIDDVLRIEVIRGPVSSLYGANAFFGIINIVTRNATETPRAWGRVSVNSISGVVSTAGFAAGDLHRQVRGTAQAVGRFGETFDNVDGIGPKLAGDGAAQYNASLVGSYDGSFLQLRAFRQRRDSPFAPYNSDPTVATPYSQYNTLLLVEGGHTREVSKRLTVAVRGYANVYRFSDHIIQIGAAPFDDIGDGRRYGAELRGRYELVADKLGVTAGTEANYNQTNSNAYTEGDQACGPMHAACIPKNFDIEGVYAEADGQPTPWLGFTAGARYDRNSVIDTRVSPRAALFLAKRERYGLKLLYAEGFRNPSAYEAFFYDNTSFSQPVNLKAETIRSYEAVLWAKPFPGLSTRFSGFYWDARGIVEQLPDPANPALLQFKNVGRFVTTGVEVEGSYRNTSGWYAFGGGAFSHVGTEEAGVLRFGSVPNAPALTASGGISTPKLFGHAHLSTEAVYIGSRPTRPDTDTGAAFPDSPGWVSWNWALYVPNVKGFDITAGVRNLLGTRDLLPAPGDYDRTNTDPATMTTTTTTVARVPGEGREIYVKAGYSY